VTLREFLQEVPLKTWPALLALAGAPLLFIALVLAITLMLIGGYSPV
jgi:hypothetical protein